MPSRKEYLAKYSPQKDARIRRFTGHVTPSIWAARSLARLLNNVSRARSGMLSDMKVQTFELPVPHSRAIAISLLSLQFQPFAVSPVILSLHLRNIAHPSDITPKCAGKYFITIIGAFVFVDIHKG